MLEAQVHLFRAEAPSQAVKTDRASTRVCRLSWWEGHFCQTRTQSTLMLIL
jgi:hypothetical protein